MFNKLLCRMGVICKERFSRKQHINPDNNNLIEEYKDTVMCETCKVVTESRHYVWNSNTYDFEVADPTKHNLKL